MLYLKIICHHLPITAAMDAQVLYALFALQIVQQNAQYVTATVVFAALDAVYQDAINVIAHHVYAAQLMPAIHAALFVIALHANAIFEHAHHVTMFATTTAKYEYLIYFIFLDKI